MRSPHAENKEWCSQLISSSLDDQDTTYTDQNQSQSTATGKTAPVQESEGEIERDTEKFVEVTSASRQGAKVVVKSGLMKQSSKKMAPKKPPKLNRAKSAPDSDGYSSSASSQGKAKGDASSIARQRALERSLKRKISLEEAKLRKENLIDHDREKRRLSDRIEQLEVLLAGSIEGKRHMEQEYLELMGKRAELKDEESMNSEVLEGPLGHESDQVAAITSQGGGAFATSDSEKRETLWCR